MNEELYGHEFGAKSSTGKRELKKESPQCDLFAEDVSKSIKALALLLEKKIDINAIEERFNSR